MNSRTVRDLVVIFSALLWAVWVSVHAFTLPSALTHPLLDHPLGAFPYWSEALWRAGRGAGGAVVVLLAAWQLGRLCLSRVAF